MPKSASEFVLSPIKAIELASAKIPGAISLAQGIPSFPTPQVVKDFVIEKLQSGLVDKYSLTTGLLELREEISNALYNEGLVYSPDSEIVVTAGSIEGITASILAHTTPGDEVLLPSPTYASYQGAIGLARCTGKFFSLDEDNNFDFQIELIKKAITPRSRLLLYCSPNNPTGTLFSEAKTRALLDLADRHNLIVLIDEVYKDFYYTEDKHFSPVQVPSARARVIRVCSFSKAYAMTGWRVGFAHGDKSLIQPLVKYHDAMVTCAPVISQYAAIAAIKYGEQYLREFKAEFRKRRNFTIEALDRMSNFLDYQLPKATYFVFPRIKDSVPFARDSTKLAYDILEKVKLALVPGIAFGPSGEQHLRISYGRDWDDLMNGLCRLEEYFSSSINNSRNPGSSFRLNKEANLGDNKVTKSGNKASSLLSNISLIKKIGEKTLLCCARLWLIRNKPTIVGIAGIKGKTVMKRSLVKVLERRLKVRSGILSYNSKTGLPLSILNLKAPTTDWEKIVVLYQALKKSFFHTDPSSILILEYGVTNREDAEALISIAKPDWLVLGDVSSEDPAIPVKSMREGIAHLASFVKPERIFWPAEDPWPHELKSDLMEQNKLSLEAVIRNSAESNNGKIIQRNNSVCGQIGRYSFSQDIVGESAARGLLASVLLAEKFNLSKDEIEEALR